MSAAFGLFIRRSLQVIAWLFRYLPADNPVGQARRLVLLLGGMPVALLLQCLHWCGFLLDELLFRGYRRVDIEQPVFIVGIPRSGTTLLQRTLTTDPAFTTMTTWECLLAPSISERYFYKLLVWPCKPFAGYMCQLRGQLGLSKRLDAIHQIQLSAPEEDFLVLLPIWSCFILIALFPRAPGIRRLGFFDQAMPVAERRLVMQFYYRMLQRHLYFHGAGRRYLAKNPSFTPMLTSLREYFDDAHFIACSRSPLATVPSQLSALRPALELAGFRSIPPSLCNFMIEMLHFYYQQLQCLAAKQDDMASFVDMNRLRSDLVGVVDGLYADMEQIMTPSQASAYERQALAMQNYTSRHHYRSQDFDLKESDIARRFQDVWPIADEMRAAS